MDNDNIPFASAPGLKFCSTNVLNNKQIRPVLDSFFEWFGLGLYRSLGKRHGDYCFKKNNLEQSVDGLIVHLFSKGSRFTIWRGAHRHKLHYIWGENSLWLTPRAFLYGLGLEPVEVTLEQGGFAIVDSRIPLSIARGTTTTFGFGTKEVVHQWKPMEIPQTPDIEETIASMKSANFGVNVMYNRP
ncbi:hypothetical protein F5Y16DRAFT_414507 [Xylariaceae sp. FL0255]|nr:hypothetical protein F5Y16DRAFT_414507 [Xylariaceae sp. FL0255]